MIARDVQICHCQAGLFRQLPFQCGGFDRIDVRLQVRLDLPCDGRLLLSGQRSQ